jgi:hypothetical protein
MVLEDHVDRGRIVGNRHATEAKPGKQHRDPPTAA